VAPGGGETADADGLVLGGGGMAEPESVVLGGGGMADPESLVLGGGGMAEQESVVVGDGGMADPDSLVLGGGVIAEPDSLVAGGGGIAEQGIAVLGGGGMAEPDSLVLGGGGITDPERTELIPDSILLMLHRGRPFRHHRERHFPDRPPQQYLHPPQMPRCASEATPGTAWHPASAATQNYQVAARRSQAARPAPRSPRSHQAQESHATRRGAELAQSSHQQGNGAAPHAGRTGLWVCSWMPFTRLEGGS
jgi:hypothetical protein